VDRDRYGRMVALCSVGGTDLSLAMLRAGHAVVWCHYVRKLRPHLLGRFQRLELDARRASLGIWARKFRPWRHWACTY
jgi:endonuclease YncB( thermonuclease family)